MLCKCTFTFILFLISQTVFSQAPGVTFPYEIFDKDDIPPSQYQYRREQVRTILGSNTALVVFAADKRNRQNDVDYEYRQNSDLLYLSGAPDPGMTLFVMKEPVSFRNKLYTEVLFAPKRVLESEVWNGTSMGPKEVTEYLQIESLESTLLTQFLDSLLITVDTIRFTSLPTKNVKVPLGKSVFVEDEVSKVLKAKKPSVSLKHNFTLNRFREVKDTHEIRLLQKAIDISIDGHLHAIRNTKAGMNEYQIEALMEFGFKNSGAHDVGYPSIVGSEYNACILHYTKNRRKTKPNELVLADCGAEYLNYTADITRTFPVNGTFSEEQRIIYDIVLEAQDSGIAACKIGNDFRAPHMAASNVITKRLKELGIIKTDNEVRYYFMHGTSHYLGLDVHDAGTGGKLKENTVLTVEPGIYIPKGSPCDKKWWNIGIRIEDDILVTIGEPKNMSAALPRTADGIEALMRKEW
ncbi:MAG: aminopeptidase P family protein [Candidatus Kapabacteria bacterium]|nr:aminopeptidase P family protein [Candidatus Kapabacteria bacterium]